MRTEPWISWPMTLTLKDQLMTYQRSLHITLCSDCVKQTLKEIRTFTHFILGEIFLSLGGYNYNWNRNWKLKEKFNSSPKPNTLIILLNLNILLMLSKISLLLSVEKTKVYTPISIILLSSKSVASSMTLLSPTVI